MTGTYERNFDVHEELHPDAVFGYAKVSRSRSAGAFGFPEWSAELLFAGVEGYVLPEDSRYWPRFVPIIDGKIEWDFVRRYGAENSSESIFVPLSPLEALAMQALPGQRP